MAGGTAGAIGGLGVADVATIPGGAVAGAELGGKIGAAGGFIYGGAPGFAKGAMEGYGPGAEIGGGYGKTIDDYISAMSNGNKKAEEKKAVPVTTCQVCKTSEKDPNKKDDDKAKEKNTDPKKDEDGNPLGTKGTQTSSKTVYQTEGSPGDRGYVRVDVENPSPGEQPGNIHAQFDGANKYYYDYTGNSWTPSVGSSPLTNSQQQLLDTPGVRNGITKGLSYLKP